jgi:hypothetical protein
MKQFIAFFVFISFVSLIVPREWIHDCDHDHAIELADDHDHDHDVNHEKSADQDDCFACDYDLDSYHSGEFVLHIPNISFEEEKTNGETVRLQASRLDLFQLRGPPVG